MTGRCRSFWPCSSRRPASIWHTPTYRFEVRQGGRPVGYLNLRVGDERRVRFVGHIGYGVDEPFRGRGLAGRAVRLVLPLAGACGIDPVWVTCGPDNPASRRTLERLGAELVEIVAVRATTRSRPGRCGRSAGSGYEGF